MSSIHPNLACQASTVEAWFILFSTPCVCVGSFFGIEAPQKYKHVVLIFPAKPLQGLWWDYAFKFLKQEKDQEKYTAIAKDHVAGFLARDDISS